jgi:hypothetical protein
VRCFTEDLVSIGWMQLDGAASGTRIGGVDQLLKQQNGITEYYTLGFSVTEIAPTYIDGTIHSWPWTMGEIMLKKANQFSIGYEYP